MSIADEMLWVCENGHVDDHHYTRDEPGQPELCSRCSGACREMAADRLAREYVERLRVNVGLVEENKQLKLKVRELNGG
jgi:hypothetical protein